MMTECTGRMQVPTSLPTASARRSRNSAVHHGLKAEVCRWAGVCKDCCMRFEMVLAALR